ncbi:MAG: hypothetical protein N3B12_02780 [Armatimonadetes bacterium]|nr:hypothetical protein [Armatimonadota bacterium]
MLPIDPGSPVEKPKIVSRYWTTNHVHSLLAAVLCLVLIALPTWTRADKAPVVPQSSSPEVKASSTLGHYDIDASGADIRMVLELLARRSSANIVIGPGVTGTVTARLSKMPLEAILDYLCTAHGLKYEKRADAYLVFGKSGSEKSGASSEAASGESPELETLVWWCRHAKPSDLISAVAKLFPNILCAEGPNSVKPELDAYSSGLGSGGTISGSTASGSTTRSTSSKIVLIGPPSDVAKARDVLEKLDTPRRQVAIEVFITEISSSASKDLGIEWSWSDIGIKETDSSGIGFGKFTKQGMSITGTLSALIKDGKANLLAQPNISVLDGECADILIGDRILYPKLVGYNQIGSPIYDKAEEKVGIYLQIAPRLAGEDEIVMTLYPQVSLVTGYLKTQAGDYPQISTREARTTVSVKSGSTLAIGGLLRNSEIVNSAKLPILSEIPIIGRFFRHDKKTRDRTEIVILLSPKIMEAK